MVARETVDVTQTVHVPSTFPMLHCLSITWTIQMLRYSELNSLLYPLRSNSTIKLPNCKLSRTRVPIH